MSDDKNLKVGQKLWYVHNDSRVKPFEVDIFKIGRKWAYIDAFDEDRIDIKTLEVDGGHYSSPGQCYLSEDEYKQVIVLDSIWDKFRSRINRCGAPKCKIDDIREAAKILKIDLGE